MLQTNINGQKLRIIRVDGSYLTLYRVMDSLDSRIPERIKEVTAKVACVVFGNREYVFIDTDKDLYELSYERGQMICRVSKMCTAIVLELSSRINVSDMRNLYTIAKELIKACDYEQIKKFENRKEDNQKAGWIPKGYHHITGNIYTGYVVADKKGNEFTYIPYLDIYVSRYEISKGSTGEARSVPGARVWTNVTFKEASKAAKKFDPVNKSSLLSSIRDVESAVKEYLQKVKFGTKVIFTCDGSVEFKTGERPENMVYNLDCLYGNHYCIIDVGNGTAIAEGLSYSDSGYYSMDGNIKYAENGFPSKEVGFRICLKRD